MVHTRQATPSGGEERVCKNKNNEMEKCPNFVLIIYVIFLHKISLYRYMVKML